VRERVDSVTVRIHAAASNIAAMFDYLSGWLSLDGRIRFLENGADTLGNAETRRAHIGVPSPSDLPSLSLSLYLLLPVPFARTIQTFRQ